MRFALIRDRIPSNLLAVGLLIAATLLFSNHARASQPCASGPSLKAGWGALVVLHGRTCLGGHADESLLSVGARELLDKPKEWSERRETAREILFRLAAHAEAQAASAGALEAALMEASSRLRFAADHLGTSHLVTRPETWNPDLNQGHPVAALGLNWRSVVETACPEEGSAEVACLSAFAEAQTIVRLAVLANLGLTLSEKQVVSDLLAELSLREKQWDAYFTQARSQYPWELILNGARLGDTRKRVRSDFSECEADAKDPACEPAGFRQPPKSQIIFLHPSIALEYIADEPGGNKLEEAVQLEIFGYNNWKWKKDGSMGRAYGAAIIASVGDHAEADDLGWGVVLHFDHRWSVGVTDRGGDTGILVSADVAKLWTKVSQRRKELMTEGDK